MQKGESVIQEYCKQQGYASFVVEGGLEYLISDWERNVCKIKDGYKGMIYDYLNDMDGRKIIYKVWSLASEQQLERYWTRLKITDKEYFTATVPVTECIWGSENAAKYKYSPEVDWWYYRVPKDKGTRW